MSTVAVPSSVLRAKPRLRGIPHSIGVLLAIPATLVCVLNASSPTATSAALVYGLSLVFLLSTSAVYHTPTWTPRVRMWLRRVDHLAIFVLIAGSYTPVCLLALPPNEGRPLLTLVWSFAALGGLLSLLWPTAPRVMNVALAVALGSSILPYGGTVLSTMGTSSLALIVVGGVLYIVGGVSYARRHPDPIPAIFGYHEVFHSLVLAAVACHYLAFWGLIT